MDGLPTCQAINLSLPAELFPSGWQTALARAPRIVLKPLPVQSPSPATINVPLRQPAIRTFGFTFPELPEADLGVLDSQPKRPPQRGAVEEQSNTARRTTRIKPPQDIIKLQDRLYYVLQPPLEALTGELRFPFQPFPYQLEGIAFLFPRHAAILADEMGLGKTMQAITAIRLLLHARELRRVLLICPKPLVTNWKREFQLWAPEIPVGVIEGNQARRNWQWQQPATPVLLANYELLVRDYQIAANEGLHFDLVLLDEAQRIKNRHSATSQVTRSIRRTRSWALTGTPVENSPEDLVGIFEFLSPGHLSSNMQARRMGLAARDYILRRRKEEVLTDLPPKMFRDAELDLTPEQWISYREAEEHGVVRLTQMGDELTIQHVFELVLRLKQICNFDPAEGSSSKLERLRADLEEVIASGQKAIVFSQWVDSLKRIRTALQPLPVLEYHGKIPARKRDRVIDQFRDDPSCHLMLMSYGAGSVGLNLQFCRYVFLFDRWWNPAVEDQAINRAHRIGASGPVTVTRMMTINTIEEHIDQVLQEKRELFETIFSVAGTPASAGLNQDEIFGLFNLRMPPRKPRSAA